jgi:hypothetical protein
MNTSVSRMIELTRSCLICAVILFGLLIGSHANSQQPIPRLFLNSACSSVSLSNNIDFQDWASLLETYVNQEGRVRYQAWCQSASDRERLSRLLQNAGCQRLELLNTSEEKKVFWINLYNAMAMEIRLRQFAKDTSLPENVWKDVILHVGGKTFSLDEIEHVELRPLLDPRIHFALHCGAKSCPILDTKRLTVESMDLELNDAARRFLGQTRGARWNAESKTLWLSKIFEWYRADFGSTDDQIVEAILPFLTEEVRNSIAQCPKDQRKLAFLEYDWALPDADEAPVRHTVYSDLLPPEVDFWIRQSPEYELGLDEANALRRRLLDPIPNRSVLQGLEPSQVKEIHNYADLIAYVTHAFQKGKVQIQALSHAMPVNEAAFESTASFSMTAERLNLQLRGEMPLGPPESTFHAFDGRWFGLWDSQPVNHDWRPSRVYQPSKAGPSEVDVRADQYAWIHNGFGWNYLCTTKSNPHPFVLGQVYYLSQSNLRKIDSRKPHVGFADIPGDGGATTRLVWITEQEIFLEEVFSQPDPDNDYYVITGIYHELLSSKPSVSAVAVQAKYTRRSQDRPAFLKLRWNPPKLQH